MVILRNFSCMNLQMSLEKRAYWTPGLVAVDCFHQKIKNVRKPSHLYCNLDELHPIIENPIVSTLRSLENRFFENCRDWNKHWIGLSKNVHFSCFMDFWVFLNQFRQKNAVISSKLLPEDTRISQC